MTPDRHLRRLSGDNGRQDATTLDMSEPAHSAENLLDAKFLTDAEFLTVEEVATVLRCCDTTVRRYISDGVLPAAKVGGRFLVARSALASIVTTAFACNTAGNTADGGRLR